MIIKCEECGLQVSDLAPVCPHCGVIRNKKKKYHRTNKKRRLPNGFGRITKLTNPSLRKPYRAMVTVGTDANGKPIGKILKPEGYFKTYNEAYEALVEYHQNPCSIDKGITVKDLYEKWSEEYFKTLVSESSERSIASAWSYCSEVYDMKVSEIRARHIKKCMEEGTVTVEKGKNKGAVKRTTPNLKSRIKSMWNIMLDYALEYELVDKNYARTFELSSDIIRDIYETKNDHMTFTDEEMKSLWDNYKDVPYADILLIQCYSGWRPQELGLIKLENVDLGNWTFTGGMKTESGMNRIVPIHRYIRPLIKRRYLEAKALESEYLFNITDAAKNSGLMMTYDKYKSRFQNIVTALNMDKRHRPHDGRKHFISMAKKYRVDDFAIKRIVGHKITDITEKVYTERNIEWLSEEMAKIKGLD